MTRQEEIREGIREICHRWRRFFVKDWDTETNYPYITMESEILCYLHSQGCVLRVERELPDIRQSTESYEDDKVTLAIETQGDMLKAGYVAVEPLIKED